MRAAEPVHFKVSQKNFAKSYKPDFRQNPKTEIHDVLSNLNSLLQPIDVPANITAKVDENGKILGFVENERIIVGAANMSMSISR